MSTPTTPTKRRIYLDAGALKNSDCLRKLCFIIIDGYTTLVKDYKMAYGSAFHKFISTFYNTKNFDQSLISAVNYYNNPNIVVPDRDFRNVAHLMLTCKQYADFYCGDNFEVAINGNGKPVVEERFTLPLLETPDVELYLFGMVDVIGKLDNEIVVCDHKVTSAYEIEPYFNNYRLDTQMLTYDYALRRLASMADSKLPIELRDPKFVIDGIFINKTSSAKFARSSIIHFDDAIRSQYEDTLKLTVFKIIDEIINETDKTYYTPTGMSNSACLGKFFKQCMFFEVCCCEGDRSAMQLKLDGDFDKRNYGPEMFDSEENE